MKLFVTQRTSFPDPESSLDDGIVDLSDDLRVERLLEAYSFGIFPWPHEDLPTIWFCPKERGVLDFKDFHIPKSLDKFYRKKPYRCTFNQRFDEVIEACAKVPRPHQHGTWITPKLVAAYKAFHRAGYAHSIECWEGEKLVGGLYGVYVGGVFSGESMFYWADNASKVCLIELVNFLKGRGLEWIDIQMVTPLLESFGGKYLSRREYLARVEKAKMSARPIKFALR
jgi:leucyl/phenylalanyl-tRNA--protein transferase